MTSIFDSLRDLGFRRGPRRLLAGIAGGLAQRFGVNVWLMRVLILVSFALPVLGPGLYAAAWILLPWQDGRIPLERAFGGGGTAR